MAGSVDPEEVAAARRKIEARLEGLTPLVVEFNFLRVALQTIEARMPGFTDNPRSKAQLAFAAIAESPGSTVSEISALSGIPLHSLYPVLRILADQGLAHRMSRRWHLGPHPSAALTSVLSIGKL